MKGTGRLDRLGPLARRALGLSGATASGQILFVLALPLLSRLFTPADFGLFTIYLSIVNICGPLAALKFDSALYGADTRENARPILSLALAVTLALSALSGGAFALFGGGLPGALGEAAREIGLLAPAGVMLAGLWSITSAWAVRCGAMSTLAIARFVQPAAMTALQLLAGIAGHSAVALIAAHLISHALYSGFILARTLNPHDLRPVFAPPLPRLIRDAGANKLFPLYVMPANVASQLVANAPPVLLGAIYGAEVAGLSGMAWRLVVAPIVVISLSLGHVFTAEVCGGAPPRAVRALAGRILVASALGVGLPILLFGLLAPAFAGPLLGAGWAATGAICCALSAFGAAQALAAPFVEITSLYRFQQLRLRVELRTSFLVFAAILGGAWLHLQALQTIWLMSAAGALGALAGLTQVWSAFAARLAQTERAPGGAATGEAAAIP